MVFYIRYGHFEYQVMLFRLFNIPASFQGYITKSWLKNSIFLLSYTQIKILIYIKNLDQSHIAAVQQVLDVLKKYSFFANFKKYCFYKDEVCFLGYIVLSQKRKMKDKKLKRVRNWLELKLIRDIQVFSAFLISIIVISKVSTRLLYHLYYY